MTRALYHTPARVYTPATFTEEYNKHGTLQQAADALGMPPTRASVIASRLRRRGHQPRLFGPTGHHR